MTKNEKIEEMARNERRAYHKAWRAAHKDRVRLHNQRYWRKRAEQRLSEKEKSVQKTADNKARHGSGERQNDGRQSKPKITP